MFDSQMIVKTNEDGVINLSVGEPIFLQEVLNTVFTIPLNFESKDFTYPNYGGQLELIDELLLKHPGKHIVVTNGGKHGLLAAMYALKKVSGKTELFHPAPYWPSYPTLASLVELDFTSRQDKKSENQITVTTSPNNPDGSTSTVTCDIWDAAYAHQMYGHYDAPLAKIEVHSASKVLGLSGFRVGWLVTDDEDLANHARHYCEITTSGVSSASQHFVAKILKEFRINEETRSKFYHIARNKLLHNGMLFNEKLSSFCEEVRGVPNGFTGMFAFFKVKDNAKFSQALKDSKVRLVSGVACGYPEDGWYRMSMGHRAEITAEALTALATKLSK